MTYADCSFQFFKLVNDGTFNIEAGRYGVFLSQIPTLIGVKLGLPLNILVYIYSASFIVLYYFVWRLCVYTLKNQVAGWLIIFSLLFGVQFSFYHPVTETHQGLIYTALLYALLSFEDERLKQGLKSMLVIICILLCSFSHPVTIFPVLFVLAFYVVNKKLYTSYLPYLYTAFMIAPVLYKFIWESNTYDANQFSELKNFGTLFPQLRSLYPYQYLSLHLDSVYLTPLLLALLGFVGFIKSKKWLQGLLVFSAVSIYFVVAIITFHKGDSDMMMEKSFLPGLFMLYLGFIWVYHQQEVNKPMSFSLGCGILLMLAFRPIIQKGLFFEERNNYIADLTQKCLAKGLQKCIIKGSSLNGNITLTQWAFSIETMLISTQRFGKPVTIYAYTDLVEVKDALEKSNIFLCTPFWLQWNQQTLNTQYFKLPETPYIEINQ
jgi:hypothetical protein